MAKGLKKTDVLTPKEQAFCEAYLTCGDATEAILKAGFAVTTKSSAANMGCKLLRFARIQRYLEKCENKLVKKVVKDVSIEREWVLTRHKDIIDSLMIYEDGKLVKMEPKDSRIVISCLAEVSSLLGLYEMPKQTSNLSPEDEKTLKSYLKKYERDY